LIACDISWRKVVIVSDVLIRDIPDEVLAAIDSRAARLGISRVEYVRRRLAQDAAVEPVSVTVEDLNRFSGSFTDLADPAVMAGAWD
jgi:plasmid stability protein